MRGSVSSLLAVLLLAAACSSPNAVVVTDLPATSVDAEVVDDAGSSTDEDGSTADEADRSDPSAPTTSSAPPLGVEGAFDPEDGRPVRVLIRPEGSEMWHWIDAQTGDYVGPGLAPAQMDFDADNVVSARAEVPANCEDEGSGLHVRVDHVTVQKSGRYIASEAVFQNADCSGEPFAWRAVAIERETGEAAVRFRVGDGGTAVTELEYDPTGTWLLISLADGSLEWQGGSGRVELEPKDASGAVVSVAEASWGTRRPVGPIVGRAFVPNASPIEDAGSPFPSARLDLEHGGDAWVVVLAASSSSGALNAAVADATAAGYELVGPTDCDLGAAAAFGWTGVASDVVLQTVSVYLQSEGDARAAAAKFEADGTPAVAAKVQTYCLD